jgi:hypothetical protein
LSHTRIIMLFEATVVFGLGSLGGPRPLFAFGVGGLGFAQVFAGLVRPSELHELRV